MSLAEFQRALGNLAASTRLCAAARDDLDGFCTRYELTGRELERLRAIVEQRGIAMHCVLYRANRMTPVVRLLPRTCAVLASTLLAELDRFWTDHRGHDIQFFDETIAFADFLRERIAGGNLPAEPLSAILEEEVSTIRSRYG